LLDAHRPEGLAHPLPGSKAPVNSILLEKTRGLSPVFLRIPVLVWSTLVLRCQSFSGKQNGIVEFAFQKTSIWQFGQILRHSNSAIFQLE
jgi:hypothetical protein